MQRTAEKRGIHGLCLQQLAQAAVILAQRAALIAISHLLAQDSPIGDGILVSDGQCSSSLSVSGFDHFGQAAKNVVNYRGGGAGTVRPGERQRQTQVVIIGKDRWIAGQRPGGGHLLQLVGMVGGIVGIGCGAGFPCPRRARGALAGVNDDL